MSGSTRRKITIRQKAQSMDPIRRLYQSQVQYNVFGGSYLFPADDENMVSSIGWSYTGYDNGSEPAEVFIGDRNVLGKLAHWSGSLNRQTPRQLLENPEDGSIDFYNRIGGHLFYDLNSYNTPVYFARGLRQMVDDSLVIREEDVRELEQLNPGDPNTPEAIEKLNSILAVAGRRYAPFFSGPSGVISDLNEFIVEHIIKRDPAADYDPQTQGRAYRTRTAANEVARSIFPSNPGNGVLYGTQTAEVYTRATNEIPEPLRPLGKYILDTIALLNRADGADSLAYKRAVVEGTLGNQNIESLPESTYSTEYYDFQAEAPFFEDYATSVSKNFLTPQNPNVLSFARATPEYNYFSKTYETAIADEKMPEPLLPNMYYYKFATDRAQGDIGVDRDLGFNESYDTLITFNDFNTDILPNIGSEQFQNYIDNIYPQMTRNVSVDLVTQLGNQFQTATTPGSGMSVYNELNSLKVNFPMYAEFSLPTPEAGEFGQLVQNNITSDMFVRALEAPVGNQRDPSVGQRQMRVVSDAYDIGDLFLEDTQEARQSSILQAYNSGLSLSDIENSFATYEVPLLSETEFGAALPLLEVYDFDTWFDNVVTSIQNNPGEQDERIPGLGPNARLQLQGIRNRMNQLKRQKMPDYGAAANGEFCESETIAYRLIKKDPSKNFEIIQNFYFANTSFVDVVNFVDTQVKYDKEYVYEVNAYSLVYGSKFTFSTINARLDFETERNDDGLTVYLPPYANFKIFTEPNVKIVEYPIFNSEWNASNRMMLLPEPHGLSIPPLKILDEPPMPPQMEILPYQGNAQNILLNFQVGVGRSQDHNGPAPQAFINMQQSDVQNLQRLALYQKSFKHYDIISPELYFESESETEIQEVQIYRTTDMNLLAVNEQEIYDSFGKEPFKILNISGDPDVPPDQVASSFDCIDTIQPNTKYYYTARSVDVHGNKSNPCTIMQVEIVFENGLVYPRVQRYVPVPPPISNRTKKMNRFVEIRAADIQTYVYNPASQNGQPIISKQGLIEEAQYQVANNDFLLRFISRDTGRRFDLKISFNKQSRIVVVNEDEGVEEQGDPIDEGIPEDHDQHNEEDFDLPPRPPL